MKFNTISLLAVLSFLASTPTMADSLGSVTGGSPATQSSMSGCIYNSSAPTLSSGQQVSVQCDVNGNLKTTSGGGGGGAITAPLGNQSSTTSVSVTSAVATSIAPAVVALSTTATQVLATGANFVSRTVCNDDAAIVEYFGPNTVTNAGANGIKLAPGQCWDFSHNTAAIFGVSASATPNARVVQY